MATGTGGDSEGTSQRAPASEERTERGAPAEIRSCPACAQPAATADRYCERCGQDLGAGAGAAVSPASAAPSALADELRTGPPGGTADPILSTTDTSATVELPAAPETRSGVGISGGGVISWPGNGEWVSSSGRPVACGGCGGTEFGVEGYCDSCGQRRPASIDHSEMRLGELAAVTDKGKRHHHNEDAVAVGHAGGTVFAVVCDGVSSSQRADTASHGAVDAAGAALATALAGGQDATDAIGSATRAAQAAAALAGGPDPGANPPSSTFVCAVVTADTVTVGWVGDSRAYWLPDQIRSPKTATAPDEMVAAVDYRYPARLTVDDSMAGQLAAAGKPMPEDVASSITGALLRWLGADAPDTRPHLLTFCPPVPGRVLVCSDGLFRYRPEPGDLAAATPAGDPLTVSQSLVQLALDAGGVDNIAVAVLPYPPSPSTEADITESGPAGREHRESP